MPALDDGDALELLPAAFPLGGAAAALDCRFGIAPNDSDTVESVLGSGSAVGSGKTSCASAVPELRSTLNNAFT